MRIFLCGNTGSSNRGCEAIIRSTCKVLNQRSGDVYLATDALDQDIKMVRETGINAIGYNPYPTSLHRAVYGTTRLIFKKSLAGISVRQKPLFNKLKKGDLCLNIGGDTYCYDRPVMSLALNMFCESHNISCVLWCCSIEGNKITNEIMEDLNRYKYIFARESLTYETLVDKGIAPDKIVKCCDPAFFLDEKGVKLPANFIVGNTVGINLSECVVTEKSDIAYRNAFQLVNYILEQTDMNVCLIPHVYNIEKNTNDYKILSRLYANIQSDRISLIDRELTCEELKYIIAKCRFFVGARTHATIAAYSSYVPTLVIGYSIKSKGIATDLFGTYKNYVIPYEELQKEEDLIDQFKILCSKETEIRNHLKSFIPRYRDELKNAIQLIIPKGKNVSKLCSQELCSGCGACIEICPQKCIEFKRDENGFRYPVIDSSRCVDCGKCGNVCSCANKISDSGNLENVFLAVNNEDNIRERSSSGGIFTELAKKVIMSGGVVFGASLDKDFSVKHIMISEIQEIDKLRGSKYVESELGDSYKRVKEILDTGRLVLFTGTPCQVGGLHAYLGNKYDNLLTQDFICHGVASPDVWKEYLKWICKKKENAIKEIRFRDKTYGWKNSSLKIVFSNDNVMTGKVSEDLFLRGFVQNLYLRESCYQCSFKTIERVSDITLADAWGFENEYHELNDDKGISIVMIHTKQGMEFFDSMTGVRKYNITLDKVKKANPMICRNAPATYLRKQFMKTRLKKGAVKVLRKYASQSVVSKAYRFIDRMSGNE